VLVLLLLLLAAGAAAAAATGAAANGPPQAEDGSIGVLSPSTKVLPWLQYQAAQQVLLLPPLPPLLVLLLLLPLVRLPLLLVLYCVSCTGVHLLPLLVVQALLQLLLLPVSAHHLPAPSARPLRPCCSCLLLRSAFALQALPRAPPPNPLLHCLFCTHSTGYLTC
jgi:hypothetical protein